MGLRVSNPIGDKIAVGEVIQGWWWKVVIQIGYLWPTQIGAESTVIYINESDANVDRIVSEFVDYIKIGGMIIREEGHVRLQQNLDEQEVGQAMADGI